MRERTPEELAELLERYLLAKDERWAAADRKEGRTRINVGRWSELAGSFHAEMVNVSDQYL